jgi:hypothetical protein
MAHVHSKNMMLYAEDAAETDAPWRRWEFQLSGQGIWHTCNAHPRWNESCKYRRKHHTLTIGEMEVPEPLREAPEVGTWVHLVSINYRQHCTAIKWSGCDDDHAVLRQGMCHTSEKDAEEHRRALILASGGCA